MSAFQKITWKSGPRIDAVFSLKNPGYKPERPVPGLNLGYNTNDDDLVTAENRERWLLDAGADPLLTSWGIQVHGKNVRVVDKPGVYPETDALVTNRPGFSLAVFVADCAAVLLADEENGITAVAHAGWKGAAAGIVPDTVRTMQSLGAEPENIGAFISPCISLKNFEVGEEVAVQFPVKVVDRTYPKPHVDLKRFVHDELHHCGIPATAIHTEPGCTFDDASQFYSFRREREKSGRMMALITLKST